MTRAVRPLLPLLLVPLLLTACGSEPGQTRDTEAPAAELATSARALGIAPELVYVIEAPGSRSPRSPSGCTAGRFLRHVRLAAGRRAAAAVRRPGHDLRLRLRRGAADVRVGG
ncbi:hypothetical protein ACR6C2_35575 [Streptomyces sp. INA 01156]